MTKDVLDDLEAVRAIVAALDGLAAKDQERALRWAREKLGLPSTAGAPTHAALNVEPEVHAAPPARGALHASNIKTFVELKNPGSDGQFAATVAYFYKFEAPQEECKSSITSDDLQDACRKVGRPRLATPSKTLLNAHAQGYLDKAGERGSYALNTIGENLVAMTLPAGTTSVRASAKRKNSRGRGKSKRSAHR
jgi:hypothetical protein